MKQLLVLITLISSILMSSVANAKWTEVAKSVAGDTYYADLERIKKHNGKIYYRQLVDYLKPLITGTISNKSYNEAECGRFRYRWLNTTFYRGPMGTGEVDGSANNPNKEWQYPSPDSVAEAELNAVCNHNP